MPDQSRPSRGAQEAAASTVQALEELAAVLTRTGGEFERLSERARRLRDELAEGMPLDLAMRGEERPLIITAMRQLVDDLTTAAHAVRRTEAQQLQLEGLSQQAIADLFGVTRQRVAILLTPDRPQGQGRGPHGPASRPGS